MLVIYHVIPRYFTQQMWQFSALAWNKWTHSMHTLSLC